MRMVLIVSAFRLAAAEGNSSGLLNLLVMSDIGHAREDADRLTHPWPMNKCAFEGAFSLYEGLYQYVNDMRDGARPNAALIMGDIAYGGGDIASTEATRLALQKYLGGSVAQDRVFVAMGNHDVHYLGCTHINLNGWCYYGTARATVVRSKWNMTFSQWRSNWLQSFPGVAKSAILPPSKGLKWMPPTRYNLNMDNSSSVYFIVGLLSGATSLHWNGDTPAHASDAMLWPDIECEFLQSSLAHGRSLGKTIFIYVTHHFNKACNDWSLIRQIDIWMYGHKHNYWQSPLRHEEVQQEGRYFPLRLLVGNGGFDEGYIDVVSFVHLKEEITSGGSRVRLNFKVLDTCISDELSCPDSRIPEHGACWRMCKDLPGGFDGGGGHRKATPSKHGSGFTFEAPRTAPPRPQPQGWGGSWRLQVSKGNNTYAWLVLGTCHVLGASSCIRSTQDESAATSFEFYDVRKQDHGNVLARVAVDDDIRAALLSSDSLLYRPSKGFWGADNGIGPMHPSHGQSLKFVPQLGPKHGWTLLNIGWKSIRDHVFSADALAVSEGDSLDVVFKRPGSNEDVLSVTV